MEECVPEFLESRRIKTSVTSGPHLQGASHHPRLYAAEHHRGTYGPVYSSLTSRGFRGAITTPHPLAKQATAELGRRWKESAEATRDAIALVDGSYGRTGPGTAKVSATGKQRYAVHPSLLK